MNAEKLEKETQVPVNMKGVIMGGRKRKISKEELIEAIRKYKTESPSELATNLNVERTTIWRRLQEIPREEIDAIFKELSDYELKPSEMVWEVFCELPEIKEFEKTLTKVEVSPRYKAQMIRGIYAVCKYFKKHPRSFNVDFLEMLADGLVLLKGKKITIEGLNNEAQYRSTVRSWYIYHGVSGKLLTSKGIGGEMGKGYGKFASEKININQRMDFFKCLETVLIEEGYEKEVPIYDSLIYWLFYTGTRISASLEVTIEAIKWSGSIGDIQTIGTVQVIDKGRHRKGRQKWIKMIAGSLKERIMKNLECQGNPQQGLLFNGLEVNKLRHILKETYKRANIKVHQPAHVWRHTASQELLDATDWNYDLVASILGWKDTKTLKECYGAMGEAIRERALKKAMGIPIKEERKIFRLLPEDTPFLPNP